MPGRFFLSTRTASRPPGSCHSAALKEAPGGPSASALAKLRACKFLPLSVSFANYIPVTPSARCWRAAVATAPVCRAIMVAWNRPEPFPQILMGGGRHAGLFLILFCPRPDPVPLRKEPAAVQPVDILLRHLRRMFVEVRPCPFVVGQLGTRPQVLDGDGPHCRGRVLDQL